MLQPGKYIRHIYNRIILENATVRAAAVTALAKFGAAVRERERKREREREREKERETKTETGR